jgi:hypothetical protein
MPTEFPPVAICPLCRHISYQEKRIGQRCGAKPGGVRCMGVFLSALNKRDWASCSVCGASGQQPSGFRCDACSGTGWSFIRSS